MSSVMQTCWNDFSLNLYIMLSISYVVVILVSRMKSVNLVLSQFLSYFYFIFNLSLYFSIYRT